MGTLTLKIDGKGLKPQDIPARELGQCIIELADAFDRSGAAGNFGIESVSEGCAAVVTEVRGSALVLSRDLAEHKLSPVQPLAAWFAKWTVSFAAHDWTTSCDFCDDDEDAVSGALLCELTTIFGECVSVAGNGNRARVMLLTADGCRLSCSASREQAKALATKLFEQVVLEVSAKLDVVTFKHKSIKIERIVPYAPTSVDSLLEDMRRLNAGRFKGIDIEAYVATMRDR